MLVWPDPTGVTIVPGMIQARACRLRVAVGMASIISRFTTTVARLLFFYGWNSFVVFQHGKPIARGEWEPSQARMEVVIDESVSDR